MLDLLSEANAWIEYNLLAAHSATVQLQQTILEERFDLADHISIAGIDLHRLGRPPHMHTHVTGAGFGYQSPHRRVSSVRSDVIDDAGSCSQRSSRNFDLHCINGNRNP